MARDTYLCARGYGGHNPCRLGNTENIPRNDNMNVLPNCVGYAVGEFNRAAGNYHCELLASVDARRLCEIAKSQKLEVGNTPKVNSVIVWDNGVYGHCAVVRQVIDKNTIRVQESGWNAKSYYWEAILNNSNGNWNCGEAWLQNGGYRFIGFIYQPIDKSLPTPIERDTTKNQFKINCDDTVRVRLDHSLNGEFIGFGKTGFYDIIQMVSQDGYNWYELEKGKWCALVPPYSEFVGVEENKQETPQIEPKEEDSPIIPTEPKKPQNEPKNDKKENIFISILKFIVELIKKIERK